MFEQASRQKLRFATAKGSLTTEDLWDLKLQELNGLAKDLNKSIKAEEEEDFLKEAKESDTRTKLMFDVVIHILNVKKAEQAEREAAADKAEKKRKLLDLLARKQDASLEGLSEEELKERIASL